MSGAHFSPTHPNTTLSLGEGNGASWITSSKWSLEGEREEHESVHLLSFLAHTIRDTPRPHPASVGIPLEMSIVHLHARGNITDLRTPKIHCIQRKDISVVKKSLIPLCSS